MRVLALLTILLVGCKGASTTTLKDDEKPPVATCAHDEDCKVVAITDCCACCPDTEMHAVSSKGPAYTRHCEGHCKVCVGPGSKDGKAVSCAANLKADDYRPVCRAGTCAYEPKKR